jgi:HSP20 family protein
MITTTLFKDPIFNNLDRIFNDSFEKTNNQKTNIETNDEDYRVQIAVPGLTKENLKITVKESTLTISYDRPEKNASIFVSSFKRHYNVPDDVDEKNITGSVENGVLEVILPKSKKKAIERLISIN